MEKDKKEKRINIAKKGVYLGVSMIAYLLIVRYMFFKESDNINEFFYFFNNIIIFIFGLKFFFEEVEE